MAISLSPLTHIPGVSNFGGHFGAYLKYAGFDALQITGISATNAMIVIDGFKNEIYITEAPAIDQVFDLEKAIVDQFLHAGHEKKDIVFLTTGIGAANTLYGCINSHYYDAVKPVDGTKGLFRTKQAGRTGLEESSLRLIVQGGLRILQRIEQVDYDVFRRRPKLGRTDWPLIGLKALTYR